MYIVDGVYIMRYDNERGKDDHKHIGEQEYPVIFPTVEQLAKTMLAPNRWQIIKAMAGKQAVSIRELSRTVNRDFRGIYNDVQPLLNGGVLDKDGEKIVLSYDRIHIEFNSDDAVA